VFGLKRFWGKAEGLASGGFWIVEILPYRYRASQIIRESSGKRLSVNQIERFSAFDELKSFCRRFLLIGDQPIILSLGSETAATVYTSQQLIRHQPAVAITEPELEGLVSQLLWRFLSARSRLDFSISQLHLRQVVVDGHRVTNPIGLSGEKIDFSFSWTAVRSSFLSEVRNFLPLEKVALVAEAGPLWVNVIANSVNPPQPFLLIPIYYDSAPVFIKQSREIKYLRTLSWGEKNLTSVLFGRLGITAGSARQIIKAYCQEEVSIFLKRKIADFWKKDLQVFRRSIEGILRKEKINRVFFWPFSFFPHQLVRFQRRAVTIEVVDNKLVTQDLGYKLKFKSGLGNFPDNLPAVMAAIEASTLSLDSLLNKIARRRVHWQKPDRN